jgi:hypothetical protein
VSDELQAEMLAELRLIRHEQQQGFASILQALEIARTPARSLRLADQNVLNNLLPAIIGSIGIGVVFTVRDLIQRAAPGDEQLSAALELVFGKVLDKKIARRAGDLFKRSAGLALNGYFIERCATAREGALWAIQRE